MFLEFLKWETLKGVLHQVAKLNPLKSIVTFQGQRYKHFLTFQIFFDILAKKIL